MKNKTIAEFYNKTTRMALFINDRMNIEEDKNRIMIEIAQMNENNTKINSVAFFMEIIDAKYLSHLILNRQLAVPYNIVRGKEGKVRAITISKDNNKHEGCYTIKIDNGTGIAQPNGFTKASKDKITLYYNLTIENMGKTMIEIRDRININNIMFEINDI